MTIQIFSRDSSGCAFLLSLDWNRETSPVFGSLWAAPLNSLLNKRLIFWRVHKSEMGK